MNFLNLFKKPTPILPTKIMGSDEIFIPTANNETGNWLPYMSQPYDSQFFSFDTLACVSFSGIHTLEALLNYYYKNNLLPKPLMDFISNPLAGFINDKGFIELSVRFTAKMAGTTKNGLAMDSFWQSVNRDGIVPKSKYNDPQGNFTYEQYFAPVPQEIVKLGKGFATIFQWNWEVVENNDWDAPLLDVVRRVLKNSPIHFATASCPRDYAGIQRYCGSKQYSHARTLYSLDDYQNVLDQYSPYVTRSENGYPLGCWIQANLRIV